MGAYTNLVEKLNDVLRTFSFELIRKHGLHVKPNEFHISVAETVTYSHYVEAGYPVLIKFSMAYVVESLTSKKVGDRIELVQHILRSLEQVPKMLHTVALVPRRDVIAYRQEVRSWFTFKGNKAKLTHEFKSKEIVVDYVEVVNILHFPSNTRITVQQRSGANRSLVELGLAALREHLYGNELTRESRVIGPGKKDSRTASGTRIVVSTAESDEVGGGEDEAFDGSSPAL